ncbi:class II bacteriocin class with double-glycine leader peptide [Luteibacter rhizovicinus]|uniref:Class II bacteriocin class with double-glycine leader peptide n=1 Tax=Luteibacter rhizovicinus TaxID=242606 RepID=A0A4R3YLK4_9GAMM|nr:Blp family class II bacteriocin [Luteibacter rhizovicinus]TCV92338.1 class II bacteriocin class with double-glycine leader peptide [Luteibacter rhizovicinus]
MQELTMNEIDEVSGGLMLAPPGIDHSYERCVGGFMLGGALFGAAIGVGTTYGFGGATGFTVGATIGQIAGTYFCD